MTTNQTSSTAQIVPITATRRLQGEAIGRVLREQYETVLAEPVPAELLDLLDALERDEADL